MLTKQILSVLHTAIVILTHRDRCLQVVKAYKQYMIDVSQMLGATSSDAESFSGEIFSYEKRIAEIFPTGNNEDPFTSHRRLTLSKLKEIAGMVR